MKDIFQSKIIIRSFLIILLLSVNNSIASEFKNGNEIFKMDFVHEMSITFSQPHFWDTLLQHYSISHDSLTGNNEDVMADVVIDGVKLDSIGVRLKGNFSFSIPSNKKPIKLHFNSFVKTKNFDGLHRLNLSNEFPDPSMLRNSVAFYILRKAGIMAPRTSFAKVFINEKYIGLFVLIEQIDRKFLSNYFNSSGGDLVEVVASTLGWYEGDEVSFFRNNFEVKSRDTTGAIDRLLSLVKKINLTQADIFYDTLNTTFDFESLIPIFAADIIFNNWDSYFYGQNYYLYRDSVENKFYYLPWDYNLSMNNYSISGGDFSILPDKNSNSLFELPLPSKIIGNKILKKKYLDELYRITQYFSEDSLKAFINQFHTLIIPALQFDEGKIFTMDQYKKSLLQRTSISEIEFEGLLSFIRYRHKQVNEMLLKAGHNDKESNK